MPPDVVLRARRAVTAAGEIARSVGVAAGRITAVEDYDALDAEQVVEYGDDVVLLPGLVDTHVHIDEPGRTDWEGFATATRAAAAGGVTTVIDMPLNSIPPTVTVEALQVKRAAAEGNTHVDLGFWAGAVPGNLGELEALHDAGVFGFKCFLLDSGVPEFGHLSPAELPEYLQVLGGLDALTIVHAEDAHEIDAAPRPGGRGYSTFLASRPRAAEDLAVRHVIDAARATGARAHILHLSSADALPLIRDARADGVRLTAETCPHYLAVSAEEIQDGATAFKCCPPIREAANRERLWAGLADGTIDCVVSDHSPCTVELKRLDSGDFAEAWGGISGLQVSLPVTWTAARRRGYGLTDVVRWMAEAPARLAGLRRKGRIEVGGDADFCVLAPDELFVVDPDRLLHKNPVSAYAGRQLDGVVRATWLRGRQITPGPARGQLLNRGDA